VFGFAIVVALLALSKAPLRRSYGRSWEFRGIHLALTPKIWSGAAMERNCCSTDSRAVVEAAFGDVTR
jgi:hypothetical protein